MLAPQSAVLAVEPFRRWQGWIGSRANCLALCRSTCSSAGSRSRWSRLPIPSRDVVRSIRGAKPRVKKYTRFTWL